MEAFYATNRGWTCSFHKFGRYFSGTGHVDDHGRDKGKGDSVNIPLKDGLTDETFKGVFESARLAFITSAPQTNEHAAPSVAHSAHT